MVRQVFDPNGDVCLLLHADDSKNPSRSRSSSEIGNSDEETGDTAKDTGLDNANETRVCAEMLVSSRHLILASPVFEAMLLQPRFAEGRELQTSKHVDIPLYDDDPEALEIVLNIIHGHPKKVPRFIGLPLLTKVAVIVDKYRTHECMELFSEVWINPTSIQEWQLWMDPSSHILSMLCISWVFKKQDHFGFVTLVAQRFLASRADEYAIIQNLPIPGPVIHKIEQCRLGAIGEAIEMLERTMKKYQEPGVHCTGLSRHCMDPQNPPEHIAISSDWNPSLGIACDSTILGGLIKEAVSTGLYPLPSPPYNNWSFHNVSSCLKSMRVPSLCQETMKLKYSTDRDNPVFALLSVDTCHQLSRTFADTMAAIEAKFKPFELTEFTAQGKTTKKATKPME